MEISKTIAQALNDQIGAEFQSAYLYLSMAAWFEDNNFPGCAHWMKKQFAEETEHALKMFQYVCNRGGRVDLRAIEVPRAEWGRVSEVFAETLAHERFVTSRIYSLYELASSEKDYATVEFLNWYLKEQVEEEASASEILSMLEKIGDSTVGIIQLDKQLAGR